MKFMKPYLFAFIFSFIFAGCAIQGVSGKKGEKGEPGIQGKQGKQGKQGIQGDEGKQGIQGIQGKEGKQGIPGKVAENLRENCEKASSMFFEIPNSFLEQGGNWVKFSHGTSIVTIPYYEECVRLGYRIIFDAQLEFVYAEAPTLNTDTIDFFIAKEGFLKKFIQSKKSIPDGVQPPKAEWIYRNFVIPIGENYFRNRFKFKYPELQVDKNAQIAFGIQVQVNSKINLPNQNKSFVFGNITYEWRSVK